MIYSTNQIKCLGYVEKKVVGSLKVATAWITYLGHTANLSLFSLQGSQLIKTGFSLRGKTTKGKPCSGSLYWPCTVQVRIVLFFHFFPNSDMIL